MSREPKPEFSDDPRASLPDPKRPCPQCDDDTAWHDRPSEREPISGHTDRIDYWCPECGAHVGIKTSYHGPEPVQVGPNQWEMH